MIIPYIKSLGVYVPDNKVTNDDLAKTVDTSDEWIYSHTGIKSRHFADKDVMPSDMATAAAEIALEKGGMSAEDIDQIIVATGTPDFIGFPSTACLVQEKIKAVNASAYDITAACSGFVYALNIAKSFIASGEAKNIIVIGTEQLSKVSNMEDRGTCVLFGDGCGAALVTVNENPEENPSAILNTYMRARGSGAKYLSRPAGGIATPFEKDKTENSASCIYMDGRRVYYFAVEVLSLTVQKLLDDAGLTIDDIKYIVPHQANMRIIEAVSKRTKIPLEKFYMNIAEYANTSSATIPIAFNEAVDKGNVKRGDYIIMVGFGAGLTYGGTLLKW